MQNIWPAMVMAAWVVAVSYLLLTYRYHPIATRRIGTFKGVTLRATSLPSSLPLVGIMTNMQLVFWDEEHTVMTRLVKASWIDFATGKAKNIVVLDYVDGKLVSGMWGGSGQLIGSDVILRGRPHRWKK